MKKDFLYYITDEQGRTYFEKPDGTFDTSSIPRALENTPDGWQEISMKLARVSNGVGIYKQYTVPLKAVGDGGRILKHIYYSQKGARSKAYLVVAKLDRATDIHEPYFLSAIDFTQFLDADYGAAITIMEGGLSKIIQAYGNTEVEIPLNVPEAVDVRHDGIELHGNAQFLITNGDSVDLRRTHTVDLTRIVGEGDSFVFGVKDTSRVVLNDPLGSTIAATEQWFLQPTVSGPVTIDLDMTVKVTRLDIAPGPSPAVNFAVNLRIQNGDTIIDNIELYRVDGPTNVYGPNILAGKVHHVVASTVINMSVNTQIYLISSIGPIGEVTGDINSTIDYQGTEHNIFKVGFRSRYAPTTIKCLRPEYVFKKIIEKISNGKYNAESIVLRNDLKDFVITSGDGIRGLTDATIKTNLNDFFKSYDARFALGMGVTDLLAIIEPEKYFFADNYIVDLGEVNNFKLSPATEHILSEIKVGGINYSYDDVNGRDEPNTTFNFTMPDAPVENVKEWIPPYRIDPYGIEFSRINLTNKNTTDNERDNTLAMINIAPVQFTGSADVSNIGGDFLILYGYFQSVFPGSQVTVSGSTFNNGVYDVIDVSHPSDLITFIRVSQNIVTPETVLNITVTATVAALNRPRFDSVEGLISPETIYNVLLSPKRAFLAHGPYIRSGIEFYDADFVTFQKADKNDKMVTVDDGVTIAEKANVQIGTLGDRLFKPHILEFTTRVPLNISLIAELSAQHKYGKVRGTWKGIPFFGYIMDIGQVPQLNPAQTWKLLCAPETNLVPLIRV